MGSLELLLFFPFLTTLSNFLFGNIHQFFLRVYFISFLVNFPYCLKRLFPSLKYSNLPECQPPVYLLISNYIRTLTWNFWTKKIFLDILLKPRNKIETRSCSQRFTYSSPKCDLKWQMLGGKMPKKKGKLQFNGWLFNRNWLIPVWDDNRYGRLPNTVAKSKSQSEREHTLLYGGYTLVYIRITAEAMNIQQYPLMTFWLFISSFIINNSTPLIWNDIIISNNNNSSSNNNTIITDRQQFCQPNVGLRLSIIATTST